MRLSLDSNVLIYAADDAEGEKHDIAVSLIRGDRAFDLFLTGQTLGEMLSVTRRKRPDWFAEVTALVRNWERLFPVESTTGDHVIRAAAICDRYKLQFWDSVILAVVADHGAEIFLTEDMQDGQVIEGVRLLNPFAPHNRDRLRDLGWITPES